MNIIMVGYSVTKLKQIEKYGYASVIVIEEEELYEARSLNQYSFNCVKDILFHEYQWKDINRSILDLIPLNWNVNAVVPGLEYGVKGAFQVAEMLGLPNCGEIAQEVLTNKIKLRERCTNIGIPQPQFLKVFSQAEVESFYQGKEIVLKPANRQASLGVIKIPSYSDISDAWSNALTIDEGKMVTHRTIPTEYLVEECMIGKEVSSEVLVYNGEIIFFNITDKEVTTGKYSVELGHVVPSLLNQETQFQIKKFTQSLVKGIEFNYGVMHAEWMITNEGPKIIECAGRPPGDSIFDLIELAYGFDPYHAYLKILSGVLPLTEKQHKNGAAIKFFAPEAGIVTKIEGIEALEHKNVIEWSLNLNPGDTIKPISSSWDRKGHLIVIADTSEDAFSLSNVLVNQVIVKTEDKQLVNDF